MNELTREECLKALDDSNFLSVVVINQDGDIDYKGEFKETVVFDLFDKLIQEHFDNPPLKFEELKEGMWVWDDSMYEKNYAQVKRVFKLTTELVVSMEKDECDDEDEYLGRAFEENRFYRREVQDEH